MLDYIEVSKVPFEGRRKYGVYGLVFLTHGNELEIYGSDGRPIKRSDIVQALSADRFLAMRGEAKVLIMGVCSGGEIYMILFSNLDIISFNTLSIRCYSCAL